MAPRDQAPPHNRHDPQAASGGPARAGTTTFGEAALRLLDNGYEPLPIRPGQKRPAPRQWTSLPIDEPQVEAWARQYPDHGVGLRTGALVGVDIDLLDPDLAWQVMQLATDRLGDTLMRVGLWPKRLLIYRNLAPLPKLSVPGVEILGAGQQFVGFGIHPDTGRPYEWVTGETPCEVPVDQLPVVDEALLQLFLAEATALTAHLAEEQRPRRDRPAGGGHHNGPTRDALGRVIDGRDGWLSTMAFHTVHDALDARERLDPQRLAACVWDRFVATTDLDRPRNDRRQRWSPQDAARKVRDKLGLLAAGRLLDRVANTQQPEDPGELLACDQARARLSDAIGEQLQAAADWWSGDREAAAPVAGIRATVGLGKSAISRERIACWQRRMVETGLAHRVLVVTPSHALAEEAATDWARQIDGKVAVLRGYEGTDPVTHEPMCRDREMVKFALHESLRVGRSVCYSSKAWHCPHHEGCPKQQNKLDVSVADVVLAPYDVIFTGFGAGKDPFGLLVIDEGCWQRAEHPLRGPPVEKFAKVGLTSGLHADDPSAAAAMADLAALRAKARIALANNGPGMVGAPPLAEAGLSAEDCAVAATLEERCIHDPGIYPGIKPRQRKAAMAIVRRNEIARRMAAIWRAMVHIMNGQPGRSGFLRITPSDPETETHGIVLHDHHRIADTLAGLPILHLDATLRPDLAELMLPGLQVSRIEAEQPYLHLTLMAGRFDKSTLCPSPDLPPDEKQRRQNRLREVVDHVRWEVRRVGSEGVLVVTYKAIEAAFVGIDGVQSAHFNAIAGLDQYRNVRLLIVVGRPLPSSDALTPLCASFFRTLAEGRYRPDLRAVRMRTGATATIRVVAHEDERAEVLRAAICDDEVIQAIGRGRGVNRTANTPLAVQVLADVALPLVHDRVLSWETVKPDIVQRMLLAGIAVDSPTDAAILHPEIFATAGAAKKVFARTLFGGQNPIYDTYREMSPKSAAYRRSGRGRSWQRAYWLEGEAKQMRALLAEALGELAEWQPDPQ